MLAVQRQWGVCSAAGSMLPAQSGHPCRERADHKPNPTLVVDGLRSALLEKARRGMAGCCVIVAAPCSRWTSEPCSAPL